MKFTSSNCHAIFTNQEVWPLNPNTKLPEQKWWFNGQTSHSMQKLFLLLDQCLLLETVSSIQFTSNVQILSTSKIAQLCTTMLNVPFVAPIKYY
jgi:hypothetical protein